MTPNPSLPSDQQLLADYAATQKAEAFSLIVSRYVDLVYAAAVRQVRDPHLAEDVTQAVFIVLTKRASGIASNTPLAGWLLLTTRNVARNALKHEYRLKRRERKAAAMTSEREEAPLTAETESIAGVLDDAMARLSEDDRAVIVQRFFNAQSHREVGAALGVSEEAASKRLSRALQRLREMLAREGVTASEVALSAALPVLAMKTAPATLVGAINAAQLGAAPATAAALAKTATAGMSMWAIAASTIALLGIGAIVTVTLLQRGAAPASPPAAQATTAPAGNSIKLTVRDAATKAPLPNATVETRTGNTYINSGTSDAQGQVTIAAPTNFESLRVRVKAEGRIPMESVWSNAVFRGELPKELSVALETGAPLQAVVVDEAGSPVAGADVRFYVTIDGNYEYSYPDLRDKRLVTDAQGRFTLDRAPTDLTNVRAEVSNPGGGAAERSFELSRLPDGAPTRLTLEKKTGQSIAGVVVDPEGKPVPGAKVVVAQDRFESNKPSAVTDAEGKFKFNNLNEYARVLTATIKGYAPQLVEFRGGDNKPLTVKLEKPSRLEGVVLRDDGIPLIGAQVEIESWRGHRALQWNTRTDNQGRFVWDEAPNDEVQVNVRQGNWASIDGFPIKPGGEPAKITMYPSQLISGKVTDATTGQPVQNFTMTYGIRWTGQKDVTWQTGSSWTLSGGKYDAKIDRFYNGGKIKVEADGYLPAESQMIFSKDGALELDFALTPGTGQSGMLVDAAGAAVADQLVYAVGADAQVYLHDGYANRLQTNDNMKGAKTNQHGMFTLPVVEGQVSLLAMSDTGFAYVSEADFDAAEHRLVMQPYAKLEGTIKLNTTPAKGARITVTRNLPSSSSASITRVATADENGQFVVTRIPPGKAEVNRQVDLGGGSSRNIALGNIDLKPGETRRFNSGGVGRPVVAKIVSPVEMEISGQTLEAYAEPAITLTEVPYPDNFLDLAPEAQAKWLADYRQAHGNAALLDPVRRQIPFIPGKDNTIRAEDVPAGRYEVELTLHTPWTQREIIHVAWGKVEFTVPDGTLPSEEVLDIGTIELKKGTSPGRSAGPRITTADGEPFDPAIIKGKIAVIHNWSLGHYELVPTLQRLAEKYKDNPKVIIVNVAMVPRPQWVKEIANRQKIPGILVVQPPPLEHVLTGNAATLQVYVGEQSPPQPLDASTAEAAIEEAIRKAG